MVSIPAMVAEIIAGIIIVAPVLWLVGKAIAGKDKFTHAIWIVVLGVVINAVLGMFVHGVLGVLVTLIVWVALIKQFFETSWIKAAMIGVIAMIVLMIVAVILGIILVPLGMGALHRLI